MYFELTEEQLAVREAAREFAQKELKPGVIERDSKMQYPAEQVRQMAELGFLGMMASPDYGGGGMDTLSYVLAMEEISKVDSSCSVIMSVNNSLVLWGIETYGTEAQKAKYIPRLASGEWVGSFCLSEPEAGSDATHQRTTAVDMGDYYLLNGTKNWITNGGTSKVHLVIAQTNPELGHRGIDVFFGAVADLGQLFIVGWIEGRKALGRFGEAAANEMTELALVAIKPGVGQIGAFRRQSVIEGFEDLGDLVHLCPLRLCKPFFGFLCHIIQIHF